MQYGFSCGAKTQKKDKKFASGAKFTRFAARVDAPRCVFLPMKIKQRDKMPRVRNILFRTVYAKRRAVSRAAQKRRSPAKESAA